MATTMDKKVSGKTALTGGTGLVGGVGLAPLVIWLFGLGNIEVPNEVAAIIGGIVTAVVTFLVAWLKPALQGTFVDTTPPAEDYVPKH